MIDITYIIAAILTVFFCSFLLFLKQKLNEKQYKKLLELLKKTVAATAEIGARESWSAAQKLQFVKETVLKVFPKINESTLEILIHFYVLTGGFGSYEKKKPTTK